MAFENAWLSEEEKKKFVEAKLRDPRFSIRSEKYLPASNWTIDRENDVALVYCGVSSREDYRKEIFVLLYKKFDNEHSIRFTLTNQYFSDDKQKELEKEYGVKLIKRWRLLDYNMYANIGDIINETEILDILSNAMSSYGVDGDPDIKLSVKALIEVEGGKYYDGTGNVKWYNND